MIQTLVRMIFALFFVNLRMNRIKIYKSDFLRLLHSIFANAATFVLVLKVLAGNDRYPVCSSRDSLIDSVCTAGTTINLIWTACMRIS